MIFTKAYYVKNQRKPVVPHVKKNSFTSNSPYRGYNIFIAQMVMFDMVEDVLINKLLVIEETGVHRF